MIFNRMLFILCFTMVFSQSAKKPTLISKVSVRSTGNVTLLPESKNVEEITESIVENNIEDVQAGNGFTESDDEMTTLDSNMTGIENVTELSADVSTEGITEVMNTTVQATVGTTTTPAPKSKKKAAKKKLRSRQHSAFCYCDLTSKSCDVNCCCDPDCSEADRAVFTQCTNDEDTQGEQGASHCSANELFYKSYSPMLLEHKANDLFCVYKDNLPPKLKKIPYKVLTTNEDFKKISNKHFSWPDRNVSLRNISFDFTKSYVYGDPIWVFDNSSLKLFDVPSSQINIYCSGNTKIKYLMNHKSKCVTELSNNVQKFNVYSKVSDIHLISSPKDVNESWIGNTEECPRNVCIAVKAFVCDPYECSPVNMSDDKLKPSCDEDMCKNIVTTAKYHFYSNGTSGFTKALVYFGLSVVDIENVFVEQNYEVQHIWVRKNSSHVPKKLSGNPGYLIHKPIIVSRYVSHKEDNKSEEIQMLDYFHDEQYYPLRNVVAFPENNKGFCVLSNISYTPVTFGENVQFQCKVLHRISAVSDRYNATFECLSLQENISNLIPHNYMKNATTKFYISSIGNPTSPNDWIQLVNDWSSKKVTGVFSDFNRTLVCENFMKRVKYSFVYGMVQEPNVKNQLNLFGAHVEYVTQSSEAFLIRDNEVSVSLVLTSMFYDITTRQIDEYASGPDFQINLPSDFFYPFTLSSCTTQQTSQIVISILVFMYFYSSVHYDFFSGDLFYS